MLRCLHRHLFGFVSLFISTAGFAFSTATHSPLPPRLDAQIYGSTKYSGVQADGMLPVGGDSEHNLHLDLQIQESTNSQWVTGLGIGYRQLINASGILGAYVFADRTRDADDSCFSFLSPGIEFLSRRVDARLNSYIPVGRHQHLLAQGLGGATFGLPTSTFTGHVQEDEYLKQYRRVGTGFDLLVGYRPVIDLPIRTMLGAYHFHIHRAGHVNGIAVGADYWLNHHWRVGARYNYDNVNRSVAALNLGVRLGGERYPSSHYAIQQRITDPIERHVSQLGHGSETPSRVYFHDLGPQIAQSHIFFFNQAISDNSNLIRLSPVTSLSQCTFENPCGPSQFNQDTLTAIASLDPNAVFYFNGGTYTAALHTGGPAGTVPITLQPNQVLESRTPDYTLTASPAQRTTFIGGFQLSSNNVLRNINIQAGSGITTGIESSQSGSSTINSSVIGDNTYAYTIGIDLSNGAQINVFNSTVFANTTALNLQTSAIANINNSVFNVNSSVNPAIGIVANNAMLTFTGSNLSVTGNTSLTGIQLYNSAASTTINNASIQVNTTTSQTVNGIYLTFGDPRLILNNSIVRAESGGQVTGVTTYTSNNPTLYLTGDIITAIGHGSARTWALYNEGANNSIVSVANSILNASNNSGGQAIGIAPSMGSHSQVILNNVHINVSSPSFNQAIPITAVIRVMPTNVICTINGQQVSCFG